jgi:HPt (histidine-containing phosphotransfer) domain-containing protein
MSDDEFKQMMAEVSAEFRAYLPARISGIDALWVQITHGEHSPQRMADLILAVHKIAGSAETFGLAAVGQAAAAAEARLELLRDAPLPPDVAAQVEITPLLDTLRHVAAGQP